MAKLDAMIKECTKPHALAHFLSGIGLGLILIALVPTLVSNALVLGIVALIAGTAWDYSVNK